MCCSPENSLSAWRTAMTKRTTTEEEKKEFNAALKEARPVAHRPQESERKTARGASGGLDGSTREKLRRGLVEPEAKLDLHGFTQESAHRTLLNFITSCCARRLKLVLVVTGGASGTTRDKPFDLGFGGGSRGVLKSLAPRWLGEPAFSAHVLGSQAAHRRHGGEGALYVYLRK